MATALISFTVQGQQRVLAGFAAIRAATKDLRPFWRDIFAPKYFDAVQDVFKMEGQRRGAGGRFAAGGKWARLSPRYAAWKETHYPGAPILVRDGPLQDSLRWGGSGLGSAGIFTARPEAVVFGTRVPYGVYHQKGTATMPARPFLDPPDPAVYAPLMLKWILRNHPLGTP